MVHNPADPVNRDVTYIAAELHQPVGLPAELDV